MSLDTLLTQPANKETGEALLRWVEDLRGRVLAGEMMIGILSEREVARAPQALERAIGCGADEAWIALADWYASPPYGEPDLVAAPATLRRAIAMNVNGARLRLAEMQWYYRRAEASPNTNRRPARGIAQPRNPAYRDTTRRTGARRRPETAAWHRGIGWAFYFSGLGRGMSA